MESSRNCSKYVGLAVAMGLAVPVAAWAQAGDDTVTGGLAEVTVTAQRRTESMQSVPVAVTAFDPASLDAHQVLTLRDVSNVVPEPLDGNQYRPVERLARRAARGR